VQSVVSDHGGKIAVDSAPGAGTTFRIELPIEQTNSKGAPGQSQQAPLDKPIITAA
jgi:nitrogen-specific signal transduction histidine kinase